MEKEIRKIIYMVLAIFLAIMVIKITLWFLPIILIGVLTYYIYNSLVRMRKKKEDVVIKDDNKKMKS